MTFAIIVSLLFLFPAKSASQKMSTLTEMVSILGFLPSWPILSAGVFVAVSGVLSLFLICEHLAVYYLPEEQKFLIGLILMVPVYAVESVWTILQFSYHY